MTRLFDHDLPRPEPGKLAVYLLGPGFGESQVVVFPDNRCMVVDACMKDGTNFPVALLGYLGINQIDVAVLTHPDLDHLKGFAEMIELFRPRRVFRYPGYAYIRDVVANCIAQNPNDKRYGPLREAMAILDKVGADITQNVCATHRPWAPAGAAYKTHFLAPTHYDVDAATRKLKKLAEFKNGEYVLSQEFKDILQGNTRLQDHANEVSLALAIEWANRKVLLAGDVENGTKSQHSGWKGVLAALDDPDDAGGPGGDVVNDVDIVKVAHHGSINSFFEDAWKRHAKTRKITAIVAPFANSSLPHDQTFSQLRAYCSRLGISAEGGSAFGRAEKAGWTQVVAVRPSTLAPCIAVLLDADGAIQLFRGAGAASFQ